MQKYSLAQFQRDYPNNDVCLERLFKPSQCVCGRNKWYRVKGRLAYACACGKQVCPLKGTIFEGSTTPLTTWFYVMYLMSQTKSGVSAAFIQRVTGVTYKCAWRMMHKVRELMGNDGVKLYGTVEADETFFKAKPWRNSRVAKDKIFNYPSVIGLVERESGRVKVKAVRNVSAQAIKDMFADNVEEGSIVRTDGSMLYRGLKRHYYHEPTIHWGWDGRTMSYSAFQPKKGDSTQAIEGFFSQLKRGIYGVYRHVTYLQAYADEYAFRYSYRRSERPVFEVLAARI